LQQIWINLVNNARDALNDTDSPEIHVSLEKCNVTAQMLEQHPELLRNEMWSKLTVSDNGKGIAKDHLEKIFEPFFTTKSKDKGTGLGLAMIYGAVKSHHGWVDVDSTLGQGTSFHVYIPLLKASQSKQVRGDGEVIAEGHGEWILVVDDDDVIREVTCELLESLNYQVLSASDGEQGLQIFQKHSDDIALLLTDVVMPKVGGWDLASNIWMLKRKLPTIFISGYAEEQTSILPEELDYVTILNKPCSIEDLSQSIQKLL